MGELTSIIDFAALGTSVKPLLSTAVTAAAGVGVLVLAAVTCWGFFKKFIKG